MAAAPRYVYSDYVGGAPRPVRATFVESGAVTVPDDEGQCVVGLCGSSSSKTSASSEVDGESSFVSTQLGSALLTSVLSGRQDVGSDDGSREILSDAEVASMLGSLPSGESRLFFWALVDVSIWHRRLAHKVNAQHLRRIWKENLVDGLSLKGNLNKRTTCGVSHLL